MSVYCVTGEGLSARNLAILAEVARILSRIRGCWLVAGDFNLTPQQLHESGWVDLVGASVCAPQVPTCNQKVMEFFVLDRRLVDAGAVKGLAVVRDSPGNPHYAVRLWLDGRCRRNQVRMLSSPSKVGASLPFGPFAESVGRGWDFLLPSQPLACSVDEAGTSLAAVLSRIERELADISMLEGKARQRAMGRAEGPRFVWKCGMGPPTSQLPKVSRVTVAWHTLAKWLADVLGGNTSFAGRAACIRANRAAAALRCHDWSTLGSSRHAVAFQAWAREVVSAHSDRVLLTRYRYGTAEVSRLPLRMTAGGPRPAGSAGSMMDPTRVVADCIV